LVPVVLSMLVSKESSSESIKGCDGDDLPTPNLSLVLWRKHLGTSIHYLELHSRGGLSLWDYRLRDIGSKTW